LKLKNNFKNMKINIKATNISLSPAISDYVEKKISNLDKFFRGVEDLLVSVEVGKTTAHHKSGDIFRAEIHISANGQNYYASADKDDLYAAIDEVKDEITRAVSSKRKRTIALFRRGGARIKEMVKNINLRPWR